MLTSTQPRRATTYPSVRTSSFFSPSWFFPFWVGQSYIRLVTVVPQQTFEWPTNDPLRVFVFRLCLHDVGWREMANPISSPPLTPFSWKFSSPSSVFRFAATVPSISSCFSPVFRSGRNRVQFFQNEFFSQPMLTPAL